MKTCTACSAVNPDYARHCMQCGQVLPEAAEAGSERHARGGGLFAISIVGSLLLSAVLMFVFDLPIVLLAGFLPLFWWKGRK